MTRWPVEPLTFSKKNPSRAIPRSTYIHPPSLAKIGQRTSEEIGNKQTDRQTDKRCSIYSMIHQLQYDIFRTATSGFHDDWRIRSRINNSSWHFCNKCQQVMKSLHYSTKSPVTTMLTYPWKCTVLHCKQLGNTWKPLVLMTWHFDYCPSTSEGDNQSVMSSAPVVSRCFPM